MNGEITFKIGDENILDDVKALWEELKQFHIEKSLDFKQNFMENTFQARKESFSDKIKNGKIFIVIAFHKDCKIGYCISSIIKNTGEIDSLYVKPEYRKNRIGTKLIETSLDWIKSNNIKKIEINVAVGNEETFGFYSKFGFAPKTTILQLVEDCFPRANE